MIQKISRELSRLWVAGGVVADEDAEIYEYGLQLLLSTIINILIIILISLTMGQPFVWLFFILAFIPLRITAGGYHAKTNFLCIISFTSTFFIFVLLIQTMELFSSALYFWICALFSLCMVFALSPVQASNKPLTPKEAAHNRKKSLIIAVSFLIPAIISLGYPLFQGKLLAGFYSGELTASLSLVVVRIIGLYEKRIKR